MTKEQEDKIRISEIRMRRSWQFDQFQTQVLEMTTLIPSHLQTTPEVACEKLRHLINRELEKMHEDAPKSYPSQNSKTIVTHEVMEGAKQQEETVPPKRRRRSGKKENLQEIPPAETQETEVLPLKPPPVEKTEVIPDGEDIERKELSKRVTVKFVTDTQTMTAEQKVAYLLEKTGYDNFGIMVMQASVAKLREVWANMNKTTA